MLLPKSKPLSAAVLHSALILLFIFTSHYLGIAQTETPLAQLIKELENKDSAARERAAQALVQMGNSSIPELIKALKQDRDSKWLIVRTLGRIGAADAVPALIEVFQTDVNMRRPVAEALGEIGPAAKAAIPVLISVLDESFNYAIDPLAKIGPPAIPALSEVLKNSKSHKARYHAAQALGKIGLVALPDLVDALKGGNRTGAFTIDFYVTVAFQNMGERAIPQLIELRKNENKLVRDTAAKAFGGIGGIGEVSVPPLLEVLKSSNDSDRIWAASALGLLGPKAKAAVRLLASYLNSRNTDLRVVSAKALGEIGPDAKIAVPLLVQMLMNKDEHRNLREAAALALGEIPPPTTEVIAILVGSLSDAEFAVRRSASSALVSLGPATVPVLILTLKNKDIEVRNISAETLAAIGSRQLSPSKIDTYTWPEKALEITCELIVPALMQAWYEEEEEHYLSKYDEALERIDSALSSRFNHIKEELWSHGVNAQRYPAKALSVINKKLESFETNERRELISDALKVFIERLEKLPGKPGQSRIF